MKKKLQITALCVMLPVLAGILFACTDTRSETVTISATDGAEVGTIENETDSGSYTDPEDAGDLENHGEEETADNSFIAAADKDTRLMLSAVCAFHDGYRTMYTREGAEAYLKEILSFDDETAEEIRSRYPAAFSDNGHAMLMMDFDRGMSQTMYHVYFTVDFGETWWEYGAPYSTGGYVEGLISDGNEYWGYGYSGAHSSATLVHFTDHMTRMSDTLYLRDLIGEDGFDPQYPCSSIRDIRFDADTQLLVTEVEMWEDIPESADALPKIRFTIQFYRDLTMDSITRNDNDE